MIRCIMLLAFLIITPTLPAQNSAPKPLDPKWVALFHSRKLADEKVELLQQEMLRRNPLLQEFKPTIEDEKIVGLDIETRYVSDLTPLKVLRDELKVLLCMGPFPEQGLLADLRPLEGMKLVEADFSSNQLDDAALKILAKMPITRLRIGRNQLTTLAPIALLPLKQLHAHENLRLNLLPVLPNARLEDVDLSGTSIAKIDALKGHPLQIVLISETRIDSIAPLKSCPTLEKLDCSFSPVGNLQPIIGMPLKSLGCGSPADPRGSIDNIELLRKLPLEVVRIYRGTFKSLEPLREKQLSVALFTENPNLSDLSPLKGMPIESLDICGTKVRNLASIEGMPLRSFFCDRCPIQDLTPLRNSLGTLQQVSLQNLPILSLEVLRGGKFTFVLLRGCKTLKDLSALKEIETSTLTLQGVAVKDWSFLTFVKELEYLEVDNPNDPKLQAVLKNLPDLRVSNGKE